ncbi:MAG: flagellar protein FlaG [Methylococcales bacterium]|nr:flagellar protein FlaG [Methylococcales bacterium]
MNNDISKIGSVSFTSLVSNAQPLKKDKLEQAVVEKQDQKKVEDDISDTKVTSLDEAKKLAKEGNMILNNVQRNLQFKVDDTTKQVVMSIVDKESGEVIRQLPSEEALELAKRLIEADGDPGGIVEDSA